MGYAIDNHLEPPEAIRTFYANLRDASKGRVKLITTHDISGPMRGSGPRTVQLLHDRRLLGPEILVSHANSPHEGGGPLYQATGAHISTTPNSEMQVSAFPVALPENHYASTGIGVDCHSWGVASIPLQARLLLQAARLVRGMKWAA